MPRRVRASVIESNGRLLLCRRPAGKRHGGLWEFPGGKRQRPESFEDCLQRELREELGVGVAVGECLFEQTHAYPERVVRLRFFRCRLIEGDPRGLEGQALAWVRPGELSAYELPPADAALVSLLTRRGDLWE